MLEYYIHRNHFYNQRHISVSSFPLSPSLSFSPYALHTVRLQWLAVYPWGSALHKQPELLESTLYWAPSSFNLCVIIAFTNIIRNPLLAIMDLYSIAGSHLSHRVTLPGLLDILDNIISHAHAVIIFIEPTLISKHTHVKIMSMYLLMYCKHRPGQYSNFE